MTDSKSLDKVRSDVMSLFDNLGVGLSFSELDKAQNWAEIRETVDPKGENIPATELVGRPFTVKKIKPVPSQYPGGPDHFYFVVGVDQDGVVFNTALGFAAVVEELDAWAFACLSYLQAERNNDQSEMDFWASMGGGQPITIKIEHHEGGQYGGYHTLA